MDPCVGFGDSPLTETQKQSLKEVANGEAAEFGKQMTESTEGAKHLDKYDKKRLKMEISVSTSTFVSSVDQALHSPEKEKPKSKTPSGFAKKMFSSETAKKDSMHKPTSALDYCKHINETLQKHRDSLELLLRSAAVFVLSQSDGDSDIETLAILSRQPKALDFQLRHLWNSVQNAFGQNTVFFPDEEASFKRDIQNYHFPTVFKSNDFATIDDFLTDLRVHMSHYCTRVWQVCECMFWFSVEKN